MRPVETTRFRRGKLPHWEARNARYFITVRLADSLPRAVVMRLQEVHRSLSEIAPRSEQFAALQRQHFLTMEKHLDAGAGASVLAREENARIVIAELEALEAWSVKVPHYTITPNHWHALIVPPGDCLRSLAEIMKRVKGRTGAAIRKTSGDTGSVWQREWFDRWLRSDTEWEKTVAYIRNNPVKAGLCRSWQEHPWTK